MGFFFTVLYVAASYLRPFELYPELAAFRIMAVLGALCAITVAFDVFRGATAWLRSPQTYLMLAFIAWIGISVVLNGWTGGALVAWAIFGVTAQVFFYACVTVNSVRRLSIFAGVIAWCTVILAVQSIAGYHLGYKEEVLVITQVTE